MLTRPTCASVRKRLTGVAKLALQLDSKALELQEKRHRLSEEDATIRSKAAS